MYKISVTTEIITGKKIIFFFFIYFQISKWCIMPILLAEQSMIALMELLLNDPPSLKL